MYRSHSFEEIKALVSREVAARLDPKKCYGVWWFNRRRQRHTQVSENGANGRTYRRRVTTVIRPREEWVAVSVPDSGIPREWVDAAREAVRDNRRSSNARRRVWELSGGIMRCGECSHAMVSHTVIAKSGTPYFYYACRTRYRKGKGACPQPLNISAARLEARIWEGVSSILKDPEQLRADLGRMIELERSSKHGDPSKETKLWAEKLKEVDRKRARYQEMAAADLITFDELRLRLAELTETRVTAECELRGLHGRQEYVNGLEQRRDTLLDSLVEVAPDALDSLTAEERHDFYKMLKLKVSANRDGSLEATGVFSEELRFCEAEIERMSSSGTRPCSYGKRMSA